MNYRDIGEHSWYAEDEFVYDDHGELITKVELDGDDAAAFARADLFATAPELVALVRLLKKEFQPGSDQEKAISKVLKKVGL